MGGGTRGDGGQGKGLVLPNVIGRDEGGYDRRHDVEVEGVERGWGEGLVGVEVVEDGVVGGAVVERRERGGGGGGGDGGIHGGGVEFFRRRWRLKLEGFWVVRLRDEFDETRGLSKGNF